MGTLFLIIMVPVLKSDGKVYIESQAMNGIGKWAENFDSLTVICPEINDAQKKPTMKWVPLDAGEVNSLIKVISLPLNYGYFKFISDCYKYRKVLSSEIDKHQFAVFSIGGLTGDWGSIAALMCIFNKRKYGVWTDRVEHNVVKEQASKKKGLKKIYNKYLVPFMMKHYHKFIIKHAKIGLFHGNDCYTEYSSYPSKSLLVHNIHYNKNDQIPVNKLRIKMSTILKSEVLNIVYSGRMSEMKGPIDWLTALNILKENNVPFKAKWFGEGGLKDTMSKFISESGLQNNVELMGFVSDKNIIKEALQRSDIFMFCHKTPESPRNLIEALKSACPIIGFGSNYSKDLISKHGGGILVKDFDCNALSSKIIELYKDRHSLGFLMQKAYEDGLLYSDDIVFRHRSEFIKSYLN